MNVGHVQNQDVAIVVGPHMPLVYNFSTTFSYRLLTKTFQYFPINLATNFRKSMRVLSLLVSLIMAAVQGYKLYNCFKRDVRQMDVFTAAMTVIHESVWTCCFLLMQIIGVFSLAKTSLVAWNDEDIRNIADEEEGVISLRRTDQLMKKLLALVIFSVIGVPVTRRIIPMVVEYRYQLEHECHLGLRVSELFLIIIYRFMTLPYMIFCIHRSCVLSTLTKKLSLKIQNTNIDNVMDYEEIFHEYLYLDKKVKKTSKEIQLYNATLFSVLFLKGGLGLYLLIEKIRYVLKMPHSTNYYYINRLETALIALTFVLETIVLFFVPLIMFGHVGKDEKKVLKTFLEKRINDDQQQPATTVDAFDVHGQVAAKWQQHQLIAGTGYKLFGIPVTKLVGFWIVVLGPVCTYVGKFLITEIP